MTSQIKTYHNAYPIHIFAVAVALISTWFFTLPNLILALLVSLVLIAIYAVSAFIFHTRIQNKKKKIIRALQKNDQNIIHNIAAKMVTATHDEAEFENLISITIDRYTMPEKVPFFYIVGFNTQCNKKVLTNAGFTLTEGLQNHGPYTCAIDQFTFHWWFTNKGVVIDLSAIMNREKNTSVNDILNQFDKLSVFLALFSQNPVKGFIYTLSTDLILAQDQSLFVQKLQALKTITQKIVEGYTTDLAYYILIQNSQKLEGFTEFLSCYVQSAITEPIGVEVNDNQINKKMLDLINYLNSLVPSMLYDKGNSYSPLLMIKFLSNLDLIRELISEVGVSINSVSTLLRCKGVYFTGVNDKQTLQLLKSSITDRLDGYYRQSDYDIFNRILGAPLAANPASQQTSPLKKLLLPIAITVIGLTEIAYLYIRNDAQIEYAKTTRKVLLLSKANNIQGEEKQLLNSLDSINPLATSKYSLVERIQRFLDFPSTKRLTLSNHKSYETILKSLFGNSLSSYINKDLRHFAALSTERELDFVQLLISFKNSKWTDSSRIYRYYKRHLVNKIALATGVEAKLKNHFMYYAKKIHSKKLNINKTLLDKTLQLLSGERLERHILHSVYARDESRPKINLMALADKKLKPYIKELAQYKIPYRFTRAGYRHFVQNLKSVLQLYKHQIESVSTITRNQKINNRHLYRNVLARHVDNHLKIWNDVFKPIRFIHFNSRAEAAKVLRLLARKPDVTLELQLLAKKHLPLMSNQKTENFSDFLETIKDNPKRSVLLKRIAHHFTANQHTLNTIKLLRTLKADNQKTWVGKNYINHLSSRLIHLLQGNKRHALVQHWNKNIYSYCVKNLTQRYPFSNTLKQTVNAKHFLNYFGHKGIVNEFYKKQLKKYVTIEKGNMRWNKKGKILGLGKNFLEQLALAHAIRDHWLIRNKLKFNFDVIPLYLDSKVNRFKLTVGKNIIKYSHGVQQYQKLSWVPDDSAATIHFTFFKPDGKTVSGTYPSNSWSWIQLIDKTIRTKKGVITFSQDGYKAQYHVGKAKALLKTLNLARRYRCLKPE